MSQILALGKGKYITIDQSWADGGKPVRYGLVGGQMVQLTDGTRPKPVILRKGEEFFYSNGLPVTKVADVSYLEEPWRSKAIAYIEATNGVAKPIQTHESQAEAAVPPKKRGRPAKAKSTAGPRRIEIKDEASFHEVAGADLEDLTEEN